MWESYALRPLHRTSVLNVDSPNRVAHGFSKRLVRSLRSVWRLDDIDYYLDSEHRRKSFAETMPVLMRDFADRQSASCVGDKWPWYIPQLDSVLSAFGSTKLIYMIRDPRGLWNSAQRFRARERGDVVLWEILRFDRLLQQRKLSRDELLTVRFEDLVRSPRSEIARVCAFLGHSTAENDIQVSGNERDPRWEWVPEASGQITPDACGKWRRQMRHEDIKAVERKARWFMEKHGYV